MRYFSKAESVGPDFSPASPAHYLAWQISRSSTAIEKMSKRWSKWRFSFSTCSWPDLR